MRTRSKSYPIKSTATIPRRSNRRRVPNIVEPEIRTIEEIVPMADRTMEELLRVPTEWYGEAIVIPKILAENFEIKTNLLQLVHANKFHGFDRDNPHTHISNFKRMTATLKYRDVSNHAIKLMLFPYSLEGAARIWYEKERPNSILTWDDLVNKFVNQFFPPSKTTHLKNEISRFTQRFEETFGEAWDYFKEMLRACPHHGFLELTQIDTFYIGLNEQNQDSLNAATGGNLLNKTTREALKIIENKSKVRYSRSKSNVSRVNTNSRDNVSKTDDRIDKHANQISNLVEIVNKQVITPATAKAVEKTCVTCGGAHAYYDCIATDGNQPSVCTENGSYNQVSSPNRASHQIPPPGLLRGNNFQNNQGYRAPMNNFQNFQNQGFQNQPFPVPSNQIQPSISNELSSYIKSNEIMIKSMQNQINVLRGDFNKQEENLRRNLNNDMRSILGSFFQNQALISGTLPSNNVPNSKGEMKAVTTRSGLASEGPSIPTNSPIEKVDEQNTKEITNKEHSYYQGSTAHIQPPVVPISIPEPDALRTQPKTTIPYPFADALLLMPKFASTIKSLLTNKDKLFELAKVLLNENCSAMLLKKLLEKVGDPSKFLIPCDFLRMDVCHALADLGTSINLMPLSIWKKLSLPELTPTRMTLELADRLITHPKGVAEDVFVKVGKFHFPTDFMVVDFEADPRVPLILGRSFLRTGHALIDVYGEEITLRYNPKSSNPTLVSDPSISESDCCKETIVKSSSPILTSFGESDFFLREIEYFLNDESIPIGIDNSFYDPEGDILFLEKLLNEDPFQLPPMDLKLAKETKAKSSIEEPPELELKELPSHLEYAFLEESEKLPVIIAKDLKDVEKEALIKVLKSHKRAIAWKIFDIKGIDPRFCTHKILMKEDYKPAVQSQRGVNLKIHDVIKKEVIELLDAGMIYPISDSPWVSPIHYYGKLNDATRKDHFLLPFMDQMLERLAGNEFYFFLDDFSGYFQIPIDSQGQEKTTFTCPYGTFAYRRMPFGLCNAPAFDILKACHEGPTGAIMVPISQRRRAIISDRGTHLCNDQFTRVMIKYGVTHRLATAYHPQTSGQVEVSNHGLKCILERTVGENRASWSDRLDDALWAFCTAFKTPIGCTPYKLVYGKSCHLLIKLEHRAYWALKHVNFDLKTAGDYRKLQLNEQNELRDQAYENFVIYKERTKKLHDSNIKNRIFNVGDQVLLFNSHIKIFSGKLKTRWSGPFTITQVFLYGTIELSQPNGPNFKMNGHRVKHYFGGDIPFKVVSNLHTFPMDK
nr:reverse transcriptase domain-containing protein [Tanacetum cinerariifolium]